ncbi:phage tail protein [Pseudomonas psychrophila]|uniref:phage tail protein n=1 Tax=Pseudomonas psychrophila TaxID=122355 RepID=UPI0002DF579B
MIDQNSQFMAILTAVGEAKQANADALGIPWSFSQMGVGDANGTDPIPDRLQTQLIHEQRRAPLNQVKIDPKNSNVIIAEQVIPENEGGWWIREIGLYDEGGDLVAVANCAPSFKPLLAQGSGKTQVVRMNFIVTSATNVTLKIDPSVVLATREYVDQWIIEVLPATRMAGTYQKVTINERGVVIEGSNPNTLAGHGITDALTQVESDARYFLRSDYPGGIPRNTASMGESGWWLCADTGLIRQRTFLHVGDIVSGNPVQVIWPTQFPKQCSSIAATLQATNGGSGIEISAQFAVQAKSVSGCILFFAEWGSQIQALSLYIQAEGY